MSSRAIGPAHSSGRVRERQTFAERRESGSTLSLFGPLFCFAFSDTNPAPLAVSSWVVLQASALSHTQTRLSLFLSFCLARVGGSDLITSHRIAFSHPLTFLFPFLSSTSARPSPSSPSTILVIGVVSSLLLFRAYILYIAQASSSGCKYAPLQLGGSVSRGSGPIAPCPTSPVRILRQRCHPPPQLGQPAQYRAATAPPLFTPSIRPVTASRRLHLSPRSNCRNADPSQPPWFLVQPSPTHLPDHSELAVPVASTLLHLFPVVATPDLVLSLHIGSSLSATRHSTSSHAWIPNSSPPCIIIAPSYLPPAPKDLPLDLLLRGHPEPVLLRQPPPRQPQHSRAPILVIR